MAGWVLAGLNAVSWGFFLHFGIQQWTHVAARLGTSFPGGEWYYVGILAIALLVSVGRFLWLKLRRSKEEPIASLIVSLVILPIYLFPYGGGV